MIGATHEGPLVLPSKINLQDSGEMVVVTLHRYGQRVWTVRIPALAARDVVRPLPGMAVDVCGEAWVRYADDVAGVTLLIERSTETY